MNITFEGRDWEFDLEAITVKQAVAMHLAYGFTLDGWMSAVAETDPRALQCLWWLMLQQDGQVTAIKDADCKLIDLSVAFADATGEDDEAAGEPDPTPPSVPPDGPLSAPDSRTATTPAHRARPRGGRAIASTPAI